MRSLKIIGPALAMVLALVPIAALASTTYRESVFGIETGVPKSTASCPSPNRVSPFAGTAQGTVNGTFQAAICHTPLEGTAMILGGTVSLSNGRTTVGSTFKKGGTIKPKSPVVVDGHLCLQSYEVTGELLTGRFGAQLTHYGFWDGSVCHVFFATVSGTATLTA